jgi:hypothetical protein
MINRNLANVLRKRQTATSSRITEEAPVIDTASVDSSSIVDEMASRWRHYYNPAPVVRQSVILAAGLFIFILASIWPPLILLLAYLLSKLIPYSFRENDDASNRRQLFSDFCRDEDLPELFKQIPETISLEETYIVNDRYVDHARRMVHSRFEHATMVKTAAAAETITGWCFFGRPCRLDQLQSVLH